MNGLLASLDILSFFGFLVALTLLLRLPADSLPPQSRLFLSLCLGLYCFVGFSNALQWGGVTELLDPLEDYAEILFIPNFLFFLYSLALAREGEEVRRSSSALGDAIRALTEEKERLAVTLASVAEGVIATDREGRAVLLNPVAERMSGWGADEAAGRPVEELFRIVREDTGEEEENPVRAVLRCGRTFSLAGNVRIEGRNGSGGAVEPSAAPILRDGSTEGAVLVLRDGAERRRLEEDAARIRRLESMGILAGGIAHDYNNILTGLLGNLSMARHHAGREAEPFLEKAERAGRRAGGLTMQLLAFSRGGAPVKRILHPEEVVREALEFSLGGTPVRLEFFSQEGLWPCELDDGQAGQVVNNMALNAVEAMPEGGALHVSLVNAYLVEGNRAHLPPGPYVLLRVTDEGKGVPLSFLGSIFEPTFGGGKGGSGLGLASVHTIVANHGGAIVVDSKEGRGTTYSAWLPASPGREAEPPPSFPAAAPRGNPSGSGRILVMDDDEDVRDVAGRMLAHLGYAPSFARDGAAAVAAYRSAREEGRPFSAVLMDLTVRGGMGGVQAVREILAFAPEAKVIVSSGWSSDPVMAEYGRHGFSGVVAKPYRVEQLAAELARLGL